MLKTCIADEPFKGIGHILLHTEFRLLILIGPLSRDAGHLRIVIPGRSLQNMVIRKILTFVVRRVNV